MPKDQTNLLKERGAVPLEVSVVFSDRDFPSIKPLLKTTENLTYLTSSSSSGASKYQSGHFLSRQFLVLTVLGAGSRHVAMELHGLDPWTSMVVSWKLVHTGMIIRRWRQFSHGFW